MFRTHAITAQQFDGYPPEARRLAVAHLPLFQTLPPAFAPLLLQQVQEYDWRFPAERREISAQLTYLESLPQERRRAVLAGFARLRLPERLTGRHWAVVPGEYSEQLSSYLWKTHQTDAFRQASSAYLDSYRASAIDSEPAAHRLGIAIIGQGVARSNYPLFRKLSRYGTRFTNVNPANGVPILLDAVAARSAAHPEAFAHWYIDGGAPERRLASSPPLLVVSYDELGPARRALLAKMNKEIRAGIAGPEPLLTVLHKLRPEDIGLPAGAEQSVLSHFIVSLLASGSGTQIFSTTFVQWTARELWRRAQPLSILARFAPRQRERPMNELLAREPATPQLDPMGSLIDADMAAFYMWIEQQRLSGAKQASFLAWFEGHDQALVVSPSLPANTESNQSVDMHWLIRQVDTY